MPRSTKSRGVRKDAATGGQELPVAEFDGQPVVKEIVDEVQDPQVEQALENAELVEPPYGEKFAAIDAEFAETDEPFTGPSPFDEAQPQPAYEEQPDEREWTVDALHGRDFDWTTMTWSPPKGTSGGTRPCLCNRIRGRECELSTKSRFSIGHDARFKGILQTAFRLGQRVPFAFEADDHAVVTDAEGNPQPLVGEVELEADAIARLVAPKLLPHVTHTSRAAQLQKLDAAAGTTVPQTAVMGKADEELTEADIDAQVDDAAGADEGH